MLTFITANILYVAYYYRSRTGYLQPARCTISDFFKCPRLPYWGWAI